MLSRYATLGTRVHTKCSSRNQLRCRPAVNASCVALHPDSARPPMRVEGGTTVRISKPVSRSGATYEGGVRSPSVAEAHESARTALTVEVRGFWYEAESRRGITPS